MTEREQVVFVGGPMDGKRRVIEADRDELRFPVEPEHGPFPADFAKQELVIYRRERITAGRHDFQFFTNMPIHDALAALLRNYSADREQRS